MQVTEKYMAGTGTDSQRPTATARNEYFVEEQGHQVGGGNIVAPQRLSDKVMNDVLDKGSNEGA